MLRPWHRSRPNPPTRRPKPRHPGGCRAEVSSSTPADSESPIELSPFLVVSEEDQGYKANSTLAGTRLRTDLRDVAAAVSVVTREFMQDLGVNNLDQLMVYTLGTEVTGLGGNY